LWQRHTDDTRGNEADETNPVGNLLNDRPGRLDASAS
jgi:hypothetical protein